MHISCEYMGIAVVEMECGESAAVGWGYLSMFL